MAKSNARSNSKSGRSSQGGDMTVYTVLLIVSSLVLLAGVGVLWTANLSQLDKAGKNDGSPFTTIAP
jgi:hypothetical protein